MEIVMVGDRYLASGIRLTGVDTIEATNDEDAAKKVGELVLEGTYKVILITERVSLKLKKLRDDLLKARRFYPVFVIIPDLEGPINERIKELHQLVNQAIGVKLELGR
jgi:vacuolar-type H+-ATPase subunit F/Vma7